MSQLDHRERLERLLRSDPWSMDILKVAQSMRLPDWAIGAGFIRNFVWDQLTGRDRTRLQDIDLLYFDPDDLSKDHENRLKQKLLTKRPELPWSVKNQARMHLRNKTRIYRNTEDAMRFWLETPTAVAVRLEPEGRIHLLAPYGLTDLFEMIIRPTPAGREKADAFESRLAQKQWLHIWPDLKIDRSEID